MLRGLVQSMTFTSKMICGYGITTYPHYYYIIIIIPLLLFSSFMNTAITSMTRINDYLFTHTGNQLFPVSYIFGNLEKSIKYSMHRISKRLNDT